MNSTDPTSDARSYSVFLRDEPHIQLTVSQICTCSLPIFPLSRATKATASDLASSNLVTATSHLKSVMFLYAKEMDFPNPLNSLRLPQMLFLPPYIDPHPVHSWSRRILCISTKLSQMPSLLLRILPKFL